MQTGILIAKIKNWIKEETELGSQEAGNVVLATASSRGEVYSRVVAIREITEKGILFFTQQRARKAKDLTENSSGFYVVMVTIRKAGNCARWHCEHIK